MCQASTNYIYYAMCALFNIKIWWFGSGIWFFNTETVDSIKKYKKILRKNQVVRTSNKKDIYKEKCSNKIFIAGYRRYTLMLME